ncbi:hypothetical protein EHI8A_095870 [Entamoeba histolytica HM-1:IMSS-B]|uniref:C2 domain-containing protein n=7 Tax=Entamoeba TaxID=5758 RepID=C4M1I6_ENTH1|nr:uncharacterized protein EDI_319320 [Entamoeba dispar SAW760]XP_649875.1 hypothetical protein EHI_001060 [Entamoeba histolytica HM-1:IMSS]EMD45332.1 Hypothetical protein EHI5A_059010 [Entamoeba histolytica KU27]EMH75178.1 hypothetical protein EHI8A_095870 [Entamoeba histolytica HM-1:IMSS-B]EMS16065.1 hypothetical protein KM1_061190 [Entamoeba histolytica HM-3:IMSS]ENY65790.1 hypothetical protein EHI7A_092790 [Entamoeba histolytica HM-1:IMSS-A]GAT95080.1 hypothetical protein CL6EHI_001060 [E|eukprot:EDR27880.1 hypothetical protein EDI_319320 [Entamoeba dispar SAW760]
MKISVRLGEAQFEKSTKLTLNLSEVQICQGRFIIVQCGDQKFQSSTEKTSTPQFSDCFSINIVPSQRPMILFEYYETFIVKSSVYKAFVIIETNHLSYNKDVSQWIEFSNGGRLFVTLRLCN